MIGLCSASKRARGRVFLSLPVALLTPILSSFLYASPCFAAQSAALTQPKEEWLGTYLGTKKIGYSSSLTEPTTFMGKSALRSTSHEVMHLSILGSDVEEDSKTLTFMDTAYQPLQQTFNITSKGSAIHLEATFDYAHHVIHCVSGSGGEQTKKDIDIPPGANLTADSTLVTEGQQLSVGKKFTFYSLEPTTIKLEPVELEVTGRASIKDLLRNETISAFVIRATMPIGQMSARITPAGDMIRGDINLGPLTISMVRESKERALQTDDILPSESGAVADKQDKAYTPPSDFALATAIQVDKPINNPRQVRRLRALISGVPDKHLLLSDARQHLGVPVLNAASGAYAVSAELTTTRFNEANSALWPVNNPDLIPYTKKVAYLDTEDAAIRATALKLRGTDTNLFHIARNIRNWVNRQMTPDASIGVPRSATDIFANRRGVCRDYATLYTALARAAGVPTRLCAGIVYAEGRFFYHAWAESYVGVWLAFDPTLYDPKSGIDFVDATHIKFAQGDVTDMFDAVRVVGKLKITIESVEE